MLDHPRLLEVLEAHDIKVSAVNGRLRVDAPKGAVTPTIVEAIRAHKARFVLPDGTRFTARAKDRKGEVRERTVRHVWCPCDRCGQAVLLDPALRRAPRKLVWPGCYLSPGCEGRHREPQADQSTKEAS